MEEAEIRESSQAAEPSRPRRSGADRFILAYVALSALLGILYVAYALLDDSDARPAPAAWSSWQPRGEGGQLFRSIAAGVSAHYGIGHASPLSRVAAGPPTDSDGQPLADVITLEHRDETTPNLVLDASSGVEYAFCGPAAGCRMPADSVALERLLHRQALELALYTFHYSKAFFVVAYLPPSADTPVRVLLLRRPDLAAALAAPLEETLAERDRRLLPGDELADKEEARIRALTGPPFAFHFLATADGSTLVLYPDTPQGGRA